MQAHRLDPLPRSPARPPANTAAHQGSATVVALDDAGRLVLDASATPPARRAASCLLQPCVGDRVWFVAEAGESFVLAVLERCATAGASQLQIEGDAELDVQGRLRITGEDVDVRSEGRLGLGGDELVVNARKGRAFVRECSIVARELLTHATKSTFVGNLFETFSDLVRSHSRNSVRTVEEIDQLRAGNIEHRASSVAELSGKNTLIGGGELVKADAAQIHLG